MSLNFKYNNSIIIGTEACIFFSKKKEIRTSLIELLFRKEKKYINKIIALFVQLEMATADLAFAVILYKLIFLKFLVHSNWDSPLFQSPSPNILLRSISSKIHSFHMIFTLNCFFVIIQIFFSSQSNSMHFLAFFHTFIQWL